MEENKKDVLPLEGEPLTTPQISEPVVNALAAALNKIETYVPTQYINDGPPDIDAEHLNHAEQAIMRVTNLANGAADAISALQSQVTQLNSDLGYYITSEDDFSHTLIGGAAQNITLNSKITLEQYTRILFLNYPGSNDGALLAIAPGNKIITAFRNNGVWEEKSSHFLATKSDLALQTQTLYKNVVIYRIGNIAMLSAPSWVRKEELAGVTIPTGYRPVKTISIPFTQQNFNDGAYCDVSTEGKINYTGTSPIVINAIWFCT